MSSIEEHGSYRRILSGLALVGSAQAIQVLLSVVRMKAVALVLGASGVGLIGLWSGLQSLAENIARMGLGVTGVKELVLARPEARNYARVGLRSYALLWMVATVLTGVLFPHQIKALIGSAEIEATTVTYCMLGSAASVASTTFLVELRGMHDTKRVAKAYVWGAFLSTLFCLLVLWILPQQAAIWFVVLPPVFAAIAAYVMNLHYPIQAKWSGRSQWPKWTSYWPLLFKAGAPIMLAGLASIAIMFFIRLTIEQEANLHQLGLFVGAFMLSEKYLGFLMKAMGTDYLPRVTSVIKDRAATIEMVTRQTHVLTSLAIPPLLMIIGLAPLILHLLYSEDFVSAALLLQILVLGDFFKMVAWPIGYLMVAHGRSKAFAIKEGLVSGLFALGVYLWFTDDLSVVGLAYLASRLFNVCFLLVYARSAIGYHLATSLI